MALDPRNWQHHVRLAFVSWGGQRLRAAHRALELCPGLALAHWLAATVFGRGRRTRPRSTSLGRAARRRTPRRLMSVASGPWGCTSCTGSCSRRWAPRRRPSRRGHASWTMADVASVRT